MLTRSKGVIPTTCVLLAGLSLSGVVSAGPREQAKRMHDRLTGVPPTAAVLDQMADLIAAKKPQAAAKIALENPYFYNLSLKHWISSWTNQEESSDAPLNDFTATVIGVIRDDIPFDRVLHDDILYTGSTAGVAAYSAASNQHYEDLEANRVDLATDLQLQQQSAMSGIAATAGVLTTRAFGEAFYSAGTNRRAVRFAFMNFMCMDMEQLSDTTRSDIRIRQDVDRSPGGDSTVFRSRCAGCHAGMDALAGAFAYYNWDDTQVVYEQGEVQDKFLQNGDIFPDGYETSDDSWVNLWTVGQNTKVGWQGAAAGSGVEEFGRMLAQTEAFPHCMAQRVYKKLCLNDPKTDSEKQHIQRLAAEFSDSNFNMKSLFAKTAVACMGE